MLFLAVKYILSARPKRALIHLSIMVEIAASQQISVQNSHQEIGLAALPPQTQIKILKTLALESYQNIYSHQEPSGLIQASLGRYDDNFFRDKVWVKDNVRAVKFALDPLVGKHLPELQHQPITPQKLYLSAISAILRLQGQPKQWCRFQSRPGTPNADGYTTIPCSEAPAIKFDMEHNPNGEIVDNWGHNQPDNWGILLDVAGKGIEKDLPVLQRQYGDQRTPGEILQHITSYLVHLKTERFLCRSIWEHNLCWSSYSTRRIVLAGLDQITKIWGEIICDSQKQSYPLLLSKDQIEDAAESLREKVTEHFPADYTDSYNHKSRGDLGQGIVLNDVDNLPRKEQLEIVWRLAELENGNGLYRYLGDPWRIGKTEAEWTMGKPIMARHYFRQAIDLYQKGLKIPGNITLQRGFKRIEDILKIKRQYGYIPELFETTQSGEYFGNNNELAWTTGYIIEAVAAGITAMSIIDKYYQH